MIHLKENCKFCNGIYNDWDFFKDEIKAGMTFIRWDEFWTIVGIYIFCYLIWGWWGIGIAFIVLYLIHLGNTGQGFVPPDKKIEYHNTCSAGFENCKICNNEYDHEFNEKYSKDYKKWYDIG